MADTELLLRGPWQPDQVEVQWREDHFQPTVEAAAAADEALEGLRERGSPAWDGVAANLVSYADHDGRLTLELQPIRWSLRLLDGGAGSSLSTICVVRDDSGRWLVGRRSDWVASWPGRWALGAAGSVDEHESPLHTMVRELAEEWSLAGRRLQVEALLAASGMTMLVGQCWVPDGAEVTANDEHDSYEWWPPLVSDWPREIDPSMQLIGRLLGG